jgi:hypothetical protein
MKDKVKEVHKELINKKMPHIIAFLEGDIVTVIIAGNTKSRMDLLDAIMADKDWKLAVEDVEK